MRKAGDKKCLGLVYREADDHIEKVDGAMEWDFKEFSWESSDLEQKEDGDLGAVVEFGRFESQKKKVESLVDLKRTMADSKNGSLNKLKEGKDPTLISSKRKIGARKPYCLVDSCKADLSDCREYYMRHRVCECHSKTPIVTVKGEEKRFCQQCSRFHSLGEFDEGKRSCRKRLDGHNRRRRKTQPGSFYSSSKNFFSTYNGPRILQFGSPHIYASPTMENTWAWNAKTEPDPSIYSPHDQFCFIDEQRSASNSFKGGTELSLQQPNNDTKQGKTAGAFLCQQALNPITSQGRGRGSRLLPSETVTLPIESGGCALYLLSTNSTQAPNMSLNNHLVQSNEAHTTQFQDSAGPNGSLASLAESAKEQDWESIINF